MRITRTEVLVIGGGQAGLAAGYYLKQSQLPFLILDASSRAGDSWRSRWDSLQLFTTARYSALPGLAFPGDPEHFPGKDDVADYLDSYARELDLPLQLNTRARALEGSEGHYRVTTDDGTYEAPNMIVATGAYQRPYVPAVASRLNDAVTQLHSHDYRRPSQLNEADVLVVGAANSGAQIAADLAGSHTVHLSRGKRLPRLPRRILGQSLHCWGDHLGLISAPLDSLRGRTQRGELLIGPSLRQLSRQHKIQLLGRTIDATDRTIRFTDGTELEVQAVIWATGYRSDYSWIHVPVLDDHGQPIHQRGSTTEPGLHFLGMHDQFSRGSSLIGWVKEDAAYIVEQITATRSLGKSPYVSG